MTDAANLHPKIAAWCWRQGWTGLRPIQQMALEAIGIDPETPLKDIVISASTAGGKTEAAFLPLLSRAATLRDRVRPAPGFDILYIAPIKALINNQVPRLEDIGRDADLPVTPWHGDAAQGGKARAMRRPEGTILITPESLEAMLMKRARDIPRLFGRLQAIVIDELHAFIGDPRGTQLLSVLHRIDLVCARTAPRIGLSATLSDMRLAAEFMRPGRGWEANIISTPSDGRDLLMGIKAVEEGDRSKGGPSAETLIAQDIYAKLRGRRNLVFAGSRGMVELISDALSESCRRDGVPDEFTAHHGNLSKAHREDVERDMRESPYPKTVVCTSTLEMGIDIGTIKAIGQVGPPSSVAAMRQRLGRSGRRDGEPAILRIWIPLNQLKPSTHPMDRLRLGLIRAIAMCELMLEGWIEPPRQGTIDLSTLLHQILSLLIERHGVDARETYRALARSGTGSMAVHGVFNAVDPALFGDLLRCMGARKLIEQAPDGALLLGEEGEKLTSDRSFFAVFKTPVDWSVFHAGRPIGTIPADEQLMAPGLAIILAGKRWKVVAVDQGTREVSVVPAKTGSPPKFAGEPGAIHRVICRRMRDILASTHVPAFLDPEARRVLEEARDAYRQIVDATTCGGMHLVGWQGGTVIFHWEGTIEANTLALRLARESGFELSAMPHAIEIDNGEPEEVLSAIRRIQAGEGLADGVDLAKAASDLIRAKFDSWIAPELLARAYAVTRIDQAWRPGQS